MATLQGLRAPGCPPARSDNFALNFHMTEIKDLCKAHKHITLSAKVAMLSTHQTHGFGVQLFTTLNTMPQAP